MWSDRPAGMTPGHPEGEAEPAQPPARCPACNGRDLTTTSKSIDASTYWRCKSCGEVWNLDRRHADSRYGYRR